MRFVPSLSTVARFREFVSETDNAKLSQFTSGNVSDWLYDLNRLRVRARIHSLRINAPSAASTADATSTSKAADTANATSAIAPGAGIPLPQRHGRRHHEFR